MGALMLAGGNDLVDRLREEQEMEGGGAYRDVPRSGGEGDRYELKAYLDRLWSAARDARSSVWDDVIEDCKRRRNGEYSPDKLAQIRGQGGSEIWMHITNVKCRAAEAWIRDVLLGTGERPFAIEPTPTPSIPPQIEMQIKQRVALELEQALMTQLYVDLGAVQKRIEEVKSLLVEIVEDMAKKRAQLMEEQVDDMLLEGDYYDALDEFISDLVTFPSAIMKGPVIRRQNRIQWAESATGDVRALPKLAMVPCFMRVSPFDIYPSPDSTGPQDGYLFERMRLSRKSLFNQIGVPGYDEDAIRKVLRESRDSRIGVTDWVDEAERDRLEGRHHHDRAIQRKLRAKQFWGAIPGYLLKRWGNGADAIVEDEDDDYEVTVLIVENVIVQVIPNDNPLQERPYYTASFDKTPGSFWGRSLPMLIADIQDMANAVARALQNNMALSSGPQVMVDVNQTSEGESITAMYPWKIWQVQQSELSRTGKPVEFFQPNSNAQELLAVFEFFNQLADEYSQIPAYQQGMNTEGGAAGTATGLSMLMSSAARGIKRVVASVDDMIEKVVESCFNWQMIHNPDPQIKLDAQVKARGSSALVMREQDAIRRVEMANMTNNPVDLQIIGIEGRAKILRGMLEAQGLNADDIVPADDKIRAMMQASAQAAAAQSAEGAGGQPGVEKGTKTMADGSPAGGKDVKGPGR